MLILDREVKNYKFNGVELQETGIYAMDWRNYQADIARFSGIDALSESYQDFSPYHFAMNNPIFYSDPTGMYSTDHNGNYSTTNTDEIRKFQEYFGKGGSVDGVGSFISENEVFKEDIPRVVIQGKGNKDTWNLGNNYLFNSYAIYTSVLKGLNNWNFQVKSDAMAESLIGVRNDRGIMMIGGYGDPMGILDIAGLYVENNLSQDDQERFFAATLLAAVILKKPQLALKELPLEENLAEDFIRVRHHTSTSAVNAIKKSGSINVSSPRPFGVDVEIAPFIRPSKVRLGQAAGGYRGGGYVEFTVPKWGVTPTPYIGGVGNSGRIYVEGHMQLDISTLSPKYVKRWWWPY